MFKPISFPFLFLVQTRQKETSSKALGPLAYFIEVSSTVPRTWRAPPGLQEANIQWWLISGEDPQWASSPPQGEIIGGYAVGSGCEKFD